MRAFESKAAAPRGVTIHEPKIIYNRQRRRFEAWLDYNDYNMRQALRMAGWRWDPHPVSRWHHDDPERVKPWARYCDIAARSKLTGNEFLEAVELYASQAASTELEIAAPAGESYREYQRAGIATALTRNNVLIADEMGLGKTIQAIGLCNVDTSLKKILIVCAAGLRLNWRDEWRKWSTRRIPVEVIRPGSHHWPLIARPGKLAEMPCAVIISYHMAGKFKDEIIAWEPDVMICDESHYIKNAGAKMTRAILGWKPKDGPLDPPIRARRNVFLTGTPILNRPAELWTTVRRLDPTGLGRSREEFTKRYVSDRTNLDELNHRLRTSIMVRRLKSEVLKELPPKTRMLVPLEIANMQHILDQEQLALVRVRAQMAELHEAVKNATADDYKRVAMLLRQGRTIAMSEIAKARHLTARAKVPQCIEHIKGVLEQTNKVIVLTHHHDVSDELQKAFPTFIQYDGRTTTQERHAKVRRFQEDPNVDGILLSIRAAIGITLTAASWVLAVELDWTPAWMSQAEDRAHRIGQDDAVFVQHLVVDGSIDARMVKLLVAKQTMLDQALGDKPVASDQSEDVFDALLRETTDRRPER